MRRAKIITTLGPSTHEVEVQKELILAGANVVRINMSHGSYEEHGERIKNIREASRLVKKEVAILMDLQGPKIRVGGLDKEIILKKDDIWVIGAEKVRDKYPEYSQCYIPTIYEKLVDDTAIGARVLFDDGAMVAKAIEKDREVLKIQIQVGGKLKSKKGINLPDSNISADCFTQKDQNDLDWGIGQKVDYVALSFISVEEDILKVKHFLKERGANIPVIAKIERPEAVRHIKKIVHVSDAIMIARGDMGVEIGNHRVPPIQKMIINYCNDYGVPVITATQMLESMIQNPAPTRAEASDVANAIWDGTDAVMLSGETAMGAYPIKVVEMMDRLVEEAEKMPKERPGLQSYDLSGITSSIQLAASLIAEKVLAKSIYCFTKTGSSCKKLSRFRPRIPVLGISNSLEVVRRMCLYWGITPYLFTEEHDTSTYHEQKIIDKKITKGELEDDDKVVITYGDGHFFTHGSANSIHVERIKVKK